MKKEVKKMKRIFVLPIVVGIVLGLCSYAYADAVTTGIKGYTISSSTVMRLDPFGDIIGAITTNITTIIKADVAGIETTTVQTQVVNAALHGGSLKTDSVETTSKSSTGDGKWSSDGVWSGTGDWSYSHYTDTYHYDAIGVLGSVSSEGGTFKKFTAAKGTAGKEDYVAADYTEGTITRVFEYPNGQPKLLKQTTNTTTWSDMTKAAILSTSTQTTDNTNVVMDNGEVITTKSVTSSTTYDKDGTKAANITKIGTVTTDYYYAYLGGSYVVSKEVEITAIDNAIDGLGADDTCSVDGVSGNLPDEWTKYTTTYNRDAHGVLSDKDANGVATPAITKIAEGHKIDTDSNGGKTHSVFNYSATPGFDAQFGWYIALQTAGWDVVENIKTDARWNKAWGDPAATGTVYQDQVDGQWYMNVTCWTNKEKTEYKTVTITLDLSALSSQQRRDMQAILQQYASSKAPLTLFGFATDEVLPDGATLTVIGLGNGPFDSHPFDFVGEKPASLQVAEADFAEFTTMMNNAPAEYYKAVFGGLTDSQRYTTYRELYTALMKGNLKIGGSITTSTGIQFRLEAENIKYGPGCRLDGKKVGATSGKLTDAWNPMRHFTNDLSKDLELL